MNPSASLTGSHRRTYEAIFRHPAVHNLAWRDVCALLGELGQVTEATNGHLKISRNGHTLTVHAPHTKEVGAPALLMELRHFLERSETSAAVDRDAHWLVVIDHHEARLYQSELRGTVPHKIQPHSAHGHSLHPRTTHEFSRGQQKLDPAGFFESVATALGETGKILVFGCGQGTSGEMNQFLTWTTLHRPALTVRIIGAVVVDENHSTPAQLLAKARAFYAQVPATRLL